MQISVSNAKAQLTDLVRRAEAGEEVVLTRRGAPTVRLSPVTTNPDLEGIRQRRLAGIDRAITAARGRGPDGGASAARSQDYLYGPDGLPA